MEKKFTMTSRVEKMFKRRDYFFFTKLQCRWKVTMVVNGNSRTEKFEIVLRKKKEHENVTFFFVFLLKKGRRMDEQRKYHGL